jgi:hypothetical protein
VNVVKEKLLRSHNAINVLLLESFKIRKLHKISVYLTGSLRTYLSTCAEGGDNKIKVSLLENRLQNVI